MSNEVLNPRVPNLRRPEKENQTNCTDLEGFILSRSVLNNERPLSSTQRAQLGEVYLVLGSHIRQDCCFYMFLHLCHGRTQMWWTETVGTRDTEPDRYSGPCWTHHSGPGHLIALSLCLLTWKVGITLSHRFIKIKSDSEDRKHWVILRALSVRGLILMLLPLL